MTDDRRRPRLRLHLRPPHHTSSHPTSTSTNETIALIMSTSLRIRGLNCIAVLFLLSLHVVIPTYAFCSPNTSARQTRTNRLRSINAVKRTDTDVAITSTSDIADIEEITNFATDNGITLSFTSFGPGKCPDMLLQV